MRHLSKSFNSYQSRAVRFPGKADRGCGPFRKGIMTKRSGVRTRTSRWAARMIGLGVVGLWGAASTVAATKTYDLTADFSLAANPTPQGWQYSQQLDQLGGGGGKVGPVVQNWNEPDFGPGQTGWEGVSPPGAHAGWAKRIDNGNDTPKYDDPVGTVLTHGNTSVLWKAPAGDPPGFIEIKGGIWNIRHFGRGGTWRILKNDVETISQGSNDDNSGDSTTPNSLANGSAGADGLSGIPYKGGDTIRLEILEGDFVAINLTIITGDTPPDPYITKQPASKGVVALGSTVTFTVEATGTAPLGYQWKKNGNDLPGKTQASLVMNNVSVNDLGAYTVVVSNSKGSRTSKPASMVADQVLPPIAHVHDLANDFSIAANPTARGWQYSEALDNQLKGGGPVGPVSNNWNSKDYGPGQPGWTGREAGAWAGWAKRISNGTDTPNLDAPVNSVITHGPNSVLWKVQPGETDKFASISGGLWIIPTGKRGQSWRIWKNDITLLTEKKSIDVGATSDLPMGIETGSGGSEALDGIPIKPGDTFRLEILPLSGPGGQVTGPYNDYVGVQLKITTSTTGPTIAIATHPISQTVEAGTTATLSVEAVGAGNISYQWQRSEFGPPEALAFSDLPGKTQQQLVLANIQPEQAGVYRVVVSNTGSNAASVPASVNVNVSTSSAGGVKHDLAGEFSLDSNPTAGGWQYSVALAAGGGVVGPRNNNWNQPDFGANQPGWLGPAGTTYAGWAKRVDNGNPTATYDDPVGSVITHGNTSVLWKAPDNDKGGLADITGGLWHIRHLNRPGTWKLWKNDSTLLSDGPIDDSVGTSAAPRSLGTGSGGAKALQNIPYQAGDTLRLEILNGDFVAVNFAITTRQVKIHDLAADFGLTANPTADGWQYSVALAAGGGVVGPRNNNWNQPDFGANQPGWLGPPGTTYAGWAKRVDNGNPTATYDDPVDSVITHGNTSVLWKAPASDKGGTADISGGLWHIRHLNRPGTWKLWKNDTVMLSDGPIDDSVGTSAAPRGLATGSGGAKALQNIRYQAGDSFRLEILNGDFVAVNFTITTRDVIIHDLIGDFSLDSNPTADGWQYSVALAAGGGVVGPKANNWNQPDFGANQPGWLGPPGTTYAGWAKRVDNGNPTATYDDPVGSVITHGNSSVIWKAPPDDRGGTADLGGGLWHIRHLNRPGRWKIWKNDSTLITEGTIDDAVGTSASPKSFGTGTTGASALNGIPYGPGDSFRLEILNGDFVAMNFIITTHPPETQAAIIQIVRSGGTLSLQWTGTAQLEASDRVTGGWAAVNGATSPYPVNPTGAQQFFRLR